jgi:monoamine oxidase
VKANSTVNVDVAIIGAGAAGIAAGRRLRARGRQVLLVEAMDRVGGRAHTVDVAGMPLDLGAGWLHSASRNPLVNVADAAGAAIDRSPAAWGKQLRNLRFPVADQRAAEQAYDDLLDGMRAGPADDVAGHAVAGDHPWRGYLDMLSGALNGAELDRVSAADFIRYEDASSDDNWRLPGGYGALIAAAAAGLPVRTGTKVSAVDLGGRHARLETSRGTIQARTIIVAVPTDVLASGAIRMGPGAYDHLHAAACLPLGRVDKLFVSIAEPDAIPPETHLLGNPASALTGSYYIRPLGRPVIECFFGGIAARAMEDVGDDGRMAFVAEELGGLLGRDFATGLRQIAGSWWHREPCIGGAYSHALPGHSGQRAILARPLHDRLFFGGEACSVDDYSTVHGAWQSGIDAADAADRFLDQAGCIAG